MNILALDTSSRAASCAILRDGALAGEFFVNIGLTHSQTAMPIVEKLLKQTATAPGDIDVFAVTTGPGSFTGLRIGISAVKGMAMAMGKPCAGVSTLEVLAAGARLFRGYICPAMDARRSQVYTATFENTAEGLHRICGDEAISIEALGKELAGLSSPVLLVGDGAALCFETLGEPAHLCLAPERFLHQRASSVGIIAQKMVRDGKLVSAADLAPAYLRLPQAERERLESAHDNSQ
ncbi:MAG: tRNA (adenosine(37)-N6)-threonylcarbamoyltransferase complex dimerization subunit type 1 TsaB [Oscillospiraceae bacterium]|nr:tRNA (adenosine(37)-N6)-threonylcarbamoyltransferase complex dimerization subunit type 1 TsaB [Oscillospiraceae bacterium]